MQYTTEGIGKNMSKNWMETQDKLIPYNGIDLNILVQLIS